MESAAAVSDRAAPSVETVYREQADRLWRSVFAFAGDPDVASDAVAEAFAQAIRRGPAVRDVAAWTWSAAFRIASGTLKARRSTANVAPKAGEHEDRYADPD